MGVIARSAPVARSWYRIGLPSVSSSASITRLTVADIDRAHASLRRFHAGTAGRTDPTSRRRISRNIVGRVMPMNEISEKKVIPMTAT